MLIDGFHTRIKLYEGENRAWAKILDRFINPIVTQGEHGAGAAGAYIRQNGNGNWELTSFDRHHFGLIKYGHYLFV